jgi:hypothetical protein
MRHRQLLLFSARQPNTKVIISSTLHQLLNIPYSRQLQPLSLNHSRRLIKENRYFLLNLLRSQSITTYLPLKLHHQALLDHHRPIKRNVLFRLHEHALPIQCRTRCQLCRYTASLPLAVSTPRKLRDFCSQRNGTPWQLPIHPTITKPNQQQAWTKSKSRPRSVHKIESFHVWVYPSSTQKGQKRR